MLQIRLLGQFDVRADGKRVVIPSRASQSLLAFLACTAGTEHRREKLAGMFWADTSDENARRNLRQELWRLRKALAADQGAGEQIILATELAISLNGDANYWLDVAQLRRPTPADDELNDLSNKVGLYQGELLPGFYDDWVVLERERVHATFEASMELLMERLVAAEHWAAVLEWGEKWLSFGDTSEPAFRALMLAHATRGDMSKVKAMYQRCADTLRKELGVEPSLETRALYEGLVKGAQVTARVQPIPSSATLTFLFADIESSVRLLEHPGDDHDSLLEEQHGLLRAPLQKWNGKQVDAQRDTFFCTFARATDAIGYAADAQRALSAHLWTRNEPVRVRMGLYTSEPPATGYMGMEVHRAARLTEAGHGGQVLLSQTSRVSVMGELPQGVKLRDLGEYRLKDLNQRSRIYQLVIDGLPAEFPPLKTAFNNAEPPAPGEAPFKGLQYFDVPDAPLFFGREALTEQLVRRLHEHAGMLVVVGASGSGKSSLVRAGVVPALKNKRVIIITPTAHPLEVLATALTRDTESITATATLMDDLGRDPRALYLWLQKQNADSGWQIADSKVPSVVSHLPSTIRHVLVVDQCEELFTLCRDDFEREAFIDNLLYALNQSDAVGRPPSSLSVVITLRADFYAHLAQYPELREVVAHNQEYIGPMTNQELRRAMEGPAKENGWDFEPGLVDLILRDVGDEPGALPLLSHALLETWKRRAGYTMTLKGYHDAGGVRGAIAQTAESVYETLSPEAQETARNIFLRLTELGEGTEDTRRRASFDELMLHTADAQAVAQNLETRAVLNTLAEARLISLGTDTAEVAHEALIREWGRLREWLNQDREGLRFHRSLTEGAQEWELLERDPGALFRGARLAQAREWVSKQSASASRVNDSEMAFLTASVGQENQEEREKEAQQLRELEAAKRIAEQSQKLAETEKGRAEESVRGAKKLRRRAYFLASAFLLALLLAGVALFFGDAARNSAAAADKNAVVADVNAKQAEAEKRIATARELSAAAVNNLTIDPERSILLAMQAVGTTAQDKTVLPEAASALHAAVQTSRVRLNLLGHTASVHSVAVNPAGTLAATVSEDGTAKVWDLKTGKELQSLRTNHTFNSMGTAAAFTPDGTHLLTVSDDNAAKLWDLQTGTVTLTLTGHSDNVWAVAVSADGKMFATSSDDKTARLWDAATGKELFTLTGHDAEVDDLAFAPDGSRLYTGSDGDGTAKAWDTQTGKLLFSFSGEGAAIGVDSIAVSPDGTLIATGEFDTNVKIWDASDGRLLRTLFGHASYIGGMAFSPDGKYLASSSEDGTARIWDPLTGRELLQLDGHNSGVLGVAFEPDGNRLVTVSRDGTGKVWDVSPAGSREWLTLAGHTDRVQGVAYSPDGARIATWSDDGTVQVSDATSGQILLALAHDEAAGADLSYSPDNKELAFPSGNGVEIVDAASGAEIRKLAPLESSVMSVAYSSDGTRLAVTSDSGEIQVFSRSGGEVLFKLNADSDRIEQVAFSPDGKRFVSASDDATAKVWDAQTGKLLLTFSDRVRMSGVAFSPDGKWIASSSNDGTIKVWDSVTGEIYFTLRGHTGATFGVAFSPDGRQLATTSVDRTVKVWTLPNVGEQVGEPLTLLGHTAAVYRAVFSPDGTRLATASRDGTSRVYVLPIQDLIQIARSRVTRALTADECAKYLHEAVCPPPS